MRPFILAVPALFLAMSCNQKPPQVTINTVPPSNGDVSFTTAYDIDEGSSLDLVVEAAANTEVTTSTLPANATFANGIFSFSPDYAQSGLYSVTFTFTSATGVSTRTIGIRVLNVIHLAGPPLTVVNEGSKAPQLEFKSNDPPGTIVTFTADLSGVNGDAGKATFDPVNGTLNFEPGFRWLDSRSGMIAINVTAEGQEIDTGKTRTSIAKVVYQINEATSFEQEIKPIFLFPVGRGTTDTSPTSKEGRACIFCHDGSASAPGMSSFLAADVFDQLVNHDVAADGINGTTCASQAEQNIKRVIPGDSSRSLLYLKIAGIDGASTTETDNTDPPCGVQMPNNVSENFLTVTDEDAWEACPTTGTACRQSYLCLDGDQACKANARLVRKIRLWIDAGALKN